MKKIISLFLALLLIGCMVLPVAADEIVPTAEELVTADETTEAEEGTEPAEDDEETADPVPQAEEDGEAATAADTALSGTCGDDVTWKLENGTLTISGTGAMEESALSNQWPWDAYKAEIQSLVIEEGVTALGLSAFSGFETLTSVTLPGTLESIANAAFYACASLKSITIPENVKYIDSWAFALCASLESVNLPKNLTDFGSSVFEQTPWLASLGEFAVVNGALIVYQGSNTVVTVPDDVTIICAYAFNSNNTVTSVTLPSSVKSIGGGAFAHCGALAEVNIPEGVTTIAENAFLNSGKLTKITVPKSVASIENRAFGYYIDTSIFDIALLPGFVLYGYTGSAAETYAKANKIEFFPLDAASITSLAAVLEEDMDGYTLEPKDVSEEGIVALNKAIYGDYAEDFTGMEKAFGDIQLIDNKTGDQAHNIPVTVLISYPTDEVAKNWSKYEFVLLHLVDGKVVKESFIPTADGLKYTGTLSPFAIGYKLKATSTGGESTTAAPTETPAPGTGPKTGDSRDFAPLVALLAASALGFGYVIAKRRRS